MSSSATPPRFVPTLTDVFHETPSGDPDTAPQTPRNPPAAIDDQLAARVMHRVDLLLERRLREAVGQLILAHTQALGPRLREEIELAVRETVRQAVAQELDSPPLSPPDANRSG